MDVKSLYYNLSEAGCGVEMRLPVLRESSFLDFLKNFPGTEFCVEASVQLLVEKQYNGWVDLRNPPNDDFQVTVIDLYFSPITLYSSTDPVHLTQSSQMDGVMLTYTSHLAPVGMIDGSVVLTVPFVTSDACRIVGEFIDSYKNNVVLSDDDVEFIRSYFEVLEL